jgi:thioredoxin-like negative regulator of GroEL
MPAADDEQRAESLTERLRGDPTNDAIALELADVLARLGRDLDLFALLSARLEEARDDLRPALIDRQRAVLDRLVAAARSEGRDGEAELYDQFRRRLD